MKTIPESEYAQVLLVFKTWFEAHFDRDEGELHYPDGYRLFKTLWDIGRAKKDGVTFKDLEYIKKLK